MAKKSNLITKAAQPTPDKHEEESRDAELCAVTEVQDTLLELYKDVLQGFENQKGRSDNIVSNWGLYNCQLDGRQFYNGTSKIFVPLVHDAVNARKTRFTNQLFPQNGRYVEVISQDGTIPHATIALAENYVRQANLRTKIMPALVKSGDLEGQYTVYVSWQKAQSEVCWKVKKKIELEDGLQHPEEEAEDIETEVIDTGGPHVEVISDPDLLVLPATADSMEDALNAGGSVTILRRWSKTKIKQMIKSGELDEDAADAIVERMGEQDTNSNIDIAKEQTSAAGVKKGAGKFVQVYETWFMMTYKKKRRIYRAFFGGSESILSCKRNPLWSDKLPIISAPVEKVRGSFKGVAKVDAVADFQIMANDAANEAMDSVAYSLMPIVLTDPLKNPRVGSMILAMGAIWEADPNSTKFVNMPALWQGGFEIVATAKAQIFQTLSVNPASITQASGRKKPNQAEIAAEQQVDLLTTADSVVVIEEGILTPLLARMLELDHQFRDKELMVRQYGQMGVKAGMEEVKPIAMEKYWQFKWFGVESAKNAQRVQQMIAGVNVLRGIPPQMYKGYELNLAPAIVQLAEDVFGPRLAPLIFTDMKSQLSQDVEQENKILQQGMMLPAHPLDDHQQHMQAHVKTLQEQGDNTGCIRAHLMEHQRLLQERVMAQAQQMQNGGQQPQQQGAAPQQQGTAQPGAQPMLPRGGQQPPGAIHKDKMIDPSMMPRRAG